MKAPYVVFPQIFNAFEVWAQLVFDTVIGASVEVTGGASLTVTTHSHVPEQSLTELGGNLAGILLVSGIEEAREINRKWNISLR